MGVWVTYQNFRLGRLNKFANDQTDRRNFYFRRKCVFYLSFSLEITLGNCQNFISRFSRVQKSDVESSSVEKSAEIVDGEFLSLIELYHDGLSQNVSSSSPCILDVKP